MMYVWLRDEFEEYDEDERADRAWPVPMQHGVIYPRHLATCDDPGRVAELFADHFHAHRDGWESKWPIDVVVRDGDRHWVVEVYRESVPEFSASTPTPLVVEASVSREPVDDASCEVP